MALRPARILFRLIARGKMAIIDASARRILKTMFQLGVFENPYVDPALLDVIFGKASPVGKLPFDIPADMPSVVSRAADLPFDMNDPLFKFGFGPTYGR
jgi:beta-glucosidase-like glycosyl hydrolase